MSTVRPPFWERGHSIAGAIAIAGLFLPLALAIRAEPSAPPSISISISVAAAPVPLDVPAASPRYEFDGDDGIFLRDASSLEVLPGAFERGHARRREEAASRIKQATERARNLRAERAAAEIWPHAGFADLPW